MLKKLKQVKWEKILFFSLLIVVSFVFASSVLAQGESCTLGSDKQLQVLGSVLSDGQPAVYGKELDLWEISLYATQRPLVIKSMKMDFWFDRDPDGKGLYSVGTGIQEASIWLNGQKVANGTVVGGNGQYATFDFIEPVNIAQGQHVKLRLKAKFINYKKSIKNGTVKLILTDNYNSNGNAFSFKDNADICYSSHESLTINIITGNVAQSSSCGNGLIDVGEACDGSNLNNQSCSGKGFLGGALSCAADCLSFNTSRCTVKSPCVDSDGLDYYNYGYITFQGVDTFYDKCDSSQRLSERVCTVTGNMAVVDFTCPNGCLNGVCIKTSDSLVSPVVPVTTPSKAVSAVDYAAEANLIASSGSSAKGLEALLKHVGTRKNIKVQTRNYSNFVKPLLKKYPKIEVTAAYDINNFITYGTASTKKLTVAQRLKMVQDYAKEFAELPVMSDDWEFILTPEDINDQVKGVKMMDIWSIIKPSNLLFE